MSKICLKINIVRIDATMKLTGVKSRLNDPYISNKSLSHWLSSIWYDNRMLLMVISLREKVVCMHVCKLNS